ncbi:MAG: diguanylate cyclase, partial [Cyanobacteria bacterium P01_H01_bin.15]
IDQNHMEAIELYDHGINVANAQQILPAEALGHELAANFWLEHQKAEFSQLHLQQALYSYERWGATRKVESLCNKCPSLLTFKFDEKQPKVANSMRVKPRGNPNSLDLGSILKGSQILSEAIVLEELLAKLMHIAIENAGAQRGFLLLEKDGDWFIEASGCIDQQEIQVLQSLPLEPVNADQEPLLSSSIIHYVARSLTNLVIDNATDTNPYAQEPYIKRNRVKSVLCIPLLIRSKLIGIIYLENNLLVGAFSTDRIEVLKLLSVQAAISLKNSRLYENLQNSEAHLAQFNQALSQKNAALEEAKSKLASYTQNLEQRVEQRTAELTEVNRQLKQQIKERQIAQRKLQEVNHELEKLATIDGLTQIANRRYFDHCLQHQWNQLMLEEHPLSLILFDVDYFKDYNDYYSHQMGDHCLISITEATRAVINYPKDLVARYGGEEFAVILSNVDQAGAIEISERIRRAIRDLEIPHVRSHVSDIVTISLGIATLFPSDDFSPMELLLKADKALYAAKQKGRDRYHIYS